jgi:hypothetical protein
MKTLTSISVGLSLIFGSAHATVLSKLQENKEEIIKYAKASGSFAAAALATTTVLPALAEKIEDKCFDSKLVDHMPILTFCNKHPTLNKIDDGLFVATCIATRLFTIGVLTKWGIDYIKETTKVPQDDKNRTWKKISNITKATLSFGGAALGLLAFVPIIERQLYISKISAQKRAIPAMDNSIGRTALENFIGATAVASRLFTAGVALHYGIKTLKEDNKKKESAA